MNEIFLGALLMFMVLHVRDLYAEREPLAAIAFCFAVALTILAFFISPWEFIF